MRTRLAALLTIPALLTACAPPQATDQAPSTTTPATPPPPAAPASTTTAAPEPPSPAEKTCTVPNVVGMVHQTAQDTMQAAGLYVLLEEDATGQGRLLVVDRNWTTTAQSVPAGQVVHCTQEITLSAKKTGE
ncbi:PASTA domain-containing protein [Actinokineospora sp. PR83]|uniref:PASTA domain-containing protein n=1 Tax=Actinokineospora sp. PR83 TaxID=2884908 RepID=UPI0027DEE70C|nr:PASTA domain-containing protein [Actinokineospora sp. PR83]MCG8915833.1 PASTA domain-containing protein [Actinokineospora sp. PR83]